MATKVDDNRLEVEAGSAISVEVEVHSEKVVDLNTGQTNKRFGFKFAGGIDDPGTSPFGDTGICITKVEPGSPADKAGLIQYDKILKANGYDLTTVTHEQAVECIKKYSVLKMLVSRRNLPGQTYTHV